MRTRTMACFVAFAIMGTACAADDDVSMRPPQSSNRPTSERASEDDTAATAAPAGTDAPAATEAPEDSEAADGSAGTFAPSATAAPDVAVNSETDAEVDPLSTFAMDVDTGSFTYARNSLENGVIPDPESVRTEEFVNALEQGYEQPDEGPFALTVDGTSAPFLGASTRVVRVGIQGRSIDDDERRDADLTFVIDISGSMAESGKLEAVRPALRELLSALRPTDRVGIVVYSDSTRVLLGSTPVSERRLIESAIDELHPEGATNVEDGLRLGYDEARRHVDPERLNRVILLSDGVANVGATGPEAILDMIQDSLGDGIDLVTVGFGFGDYNDSLMEQLADQGDGFYAYVDGEQEAIRLFREDLTGTLQTIAREAKVQVEFNPETVGTYRLIGFENRAVADDDFRDDSVDGGEVGAGHTVTALYEVMLRESRSADDSWIARAGIRWLDPDNGAPSELSSTLLGGDVATSIADSSLRLQQDIYVAAFAESLRMSGWADLISLEGLSGNLHSVAARLDDRDVSAMADMIDARIQLG